LDVLLTSAVMHVVLCFQCSFLSSWCPAVFS